MVVKFLVLPSPQNCQMNWTQIDSGLPGVCAVNALVVSGANPFAGTYGNGVWRRPLFEIIMGIKNQHNNLPANFALHQNYPNPFNPATTINYSLPKSGLVTIKVYDILGREIITLVNEINSPGNYTIQFNGSKLSSGIYFYRMQAGNFIRQKNNIIEMKVIYQPS
jgi:hypothetical protein